MIVSFTPIRSGSKGVPNKNIRILNGIPLFHHVVLQALKVSSLNEVWFSTDSDHYAELAPPGVKVHKRSTETATDKSPTEDVVMEFVKTRPDIATVVLLQATSPTTTSKDIEEALRISASGKGCISVQPANVYLYEDNKPLWTKKTPRQDSKTFAVDGGIYVIHVADFLKTNSIPTMPCQTMVIKHPVCDIDTEEDFKRASALVSLTLTAFIDVDETSVRLKSNYNTEQWSTQTLCGSENQLKSFILA
ncbi:N-acylneuraminate cytidylyltransferase-like [Mercenaria mercenaria]|uniref:N-acylneuraminate cytidylyltransferase-like n=1 Tax=Mercenaria mercenaria TaxID=6596 RepID=UPI00234E91F8|nr:N-acylneuraminate cytidylyltransferase-like [Mercenaria mercenaria]